MTQTSTKRNLWRIGQIECVGSVPTGVEWPVMKHSPVSVYRFYNYDVDKYGEPFRLCDDCAKKQIVPANCDLRKLADKAIGECQRANQ